MNLFMGQFILIIVYFTYRYLLDKISLEAFEKGIKLAKECHAILDTASQKVTEIKQSGEAAPFDPEA